MVKVLNDLIRTSEDRRRTFADAAREATRSELRILFQRRAIDCGTAVIELQRLVRSLGGRAKRRGTVAGMVHRIWARAKTTLGDANIAMLREVECIEGQAKAAYARALDARLPAHIRSTVQLQHYGAIRNHGLIHDLRRCYRVTRNLYGPGGLT